MSGSWNRPTPNGHPARVSVVGTTGVGTSTLARQLAEILGADYVELDALHWGPDWAAADGEELRRTVGHRLTGDRWVVDGQHHPLGVQPMVWDAADTVVWMDYPFHTILRRLLVRTMRRVVSGAELRNGNRETLRPATGSDKTIAWLFRSYAANRERYQAAMNSPELGGLAFVRLGSPLAARRWLATLRP